MYRVLALCLLAIGVGQGAFAMNSALIGLWEKVNVGSESEAYACNTRFRSIRNAVYSIETDTMIQVFPSIQFPTLDIRNRLDQAAFDGVLFQDGEDTSYAIRFSAQPKADRAAAPGAGDSVPVQSVALEQTSHDVIEVYRKDSLANDPSGEWTLDGVYCRIDAMRMANKYGKQREDLQDRKLLLTGTWASAGWEATLDSRAKVLTLNANGNETRYDLLVLDNNRLVLIPTVSASLQAPLPIPLYSAIEYSFDDQELPGDRIVDDGILVLTWNDGDEELSLSKQQ